MKIYHYDKINGEAIGVSDARLDPLETKKQGQDVFLIPAKVTIDAPPPVAANEVAVFNGITWDTEEDFRGVVYWLPDRSKHTITKIGELKPGNALDKEPPVVIDPIEPPTQAQIYKRLVSKEARAIAIAALIDRGELPADYKEG